jgi:hypothetical protein
MPFKGIQSSNAKTKGEVMYICMYAKDRIFPLYMHLKDHKISYHNHLAHQLENPRKFLMPFKGIQSLNAKQRARRLKINCKSIGRLIRCLCRLQCHRSGFFRCRKCGRTCTVMRILGVSNSGGNRSNCNWCSWC